MWIHLRKKCKFSAGMVSLQDRYVTVELPGTLVPLAGKWDMGCPGKCGSWQTRALILPAEVCGIREHAGQGVSGSMRNA